VLKAQSYSPGTGIPLPVKDHFVCYEAKATAHQTGFVATAKIENQFEYTIVWAKDHPRWLCVPTAKKRISLEPRPAHHHDDDADDDDDDHHRGKNDDTKGRRK
jgi:hypothetical protein